MSVVEDAIVGHTKEVDVKPIKRVLVYVAEKYNLRIYGVQVLGLPAEIDCSQCLYQTNGDCAETDCKRHPANNVDSFCSHCSYGNNCEETSCKERRAYKRRDLLIAFETLEKTR